MPLLFRARAGHPQAGTPQAVAEQVYREADAGEEPLTERSATLRKLIAALISRS